MRAGANHDDQLSPAVPTCNPTGNGVLMYSSVTSGSHSAMFSQCSKDTIAATATAKGACFKTAAQLATTATTCSAGVTTTVAVTAPARMLVIA
jgi:hypothetical protein